MEIVSYLKTASFHPVKVFVTFETEQAQRRCLKALTRGVIPAAFDWRGGLKDSHVFKGTNVLAVAEAPEVNEVLWEDVDVNFAKRVKEQSWTFATAILFIALSIEVSTVLSDLGGPEAAAGWISVSNIVIPLYLRYQALMNEHHVSLESQQQSLFFKLAAFRWLNSAIVIYMITPFTSTLTARTLTQVQAVLIADALTTPIVRTFDPMDMINKLIVSRFAFTQEKMNSYFLGTIWYPAERYADMTKTCFLALFWAALYPQGLFITSLAFAMAYVLDKFSLLRTWRTPAEVSDSLARKSRAHLALAMYCHVVMTMVFFAGFPFDNACPAIPHESLHEDVYAYAMAKYNVTTPLVYEECNQDMIQRAFEIAIGKPVVQRYMYSKQKRAVGLYAGIVVFMTLILIGVFFGKTFYDFVMHLFYGSFAEETDANEQHFSDCRPYIQAYVPQIFHARLSYPLIAVDVDEIKDKSFLSFEEGDKVGLYKAQCLNRRSELPTMRDDKRKLCFSRIMHFPPDNVEISEAITKTRTSLLDQGLGGIKKAQRASRDSISGISSGLPLSGIHRGGGAGAVPSYEQVADDEKAPPADDEEDDDGEEASMV